jgi:hypothetical protein
MKIMYREAVVRKHGGSDHPHAREIADAYLSGDGVTEIRARWRLNNDRLYQILNAMKIPLRARPNRASIPGQLQIPEGLLAVVEHIRFLPRKDQEAILRRWMDGATKEECLGMWQKFVFDYNL